MKNTMRLLIGFDGSPGAIAAVEDLKNAGLPDHLHALVVTVVDAMLPPEGSGERETPLPASIAASFKKSENEARRQIEDARALAEQCAQSLRTEFPNWTIETTAFADSPAWGIISKSREWKADLIVVGALGISSPARLILGSVSQRVVTDAPCSVRVVHGTPKSRSHVRILIGVDGSSHADRAIDEVGRRQWPKGSEARIVTVADSNMVASHFHSDSALRRWITEGDADEHVWVGRLIEEAAKKLRDRGLTVTHLQSDKNPKNVLLEESENWKADCVFVGARGLSGLKHFLIGSVSAAVAARAHCTVEVVRDRS